MREILGKLPTRAVTFTDNQAFEAGPILATDDSNSFEPTALEQYGEYTMTSIRTISAITLLAALTACDVFGSVYLDDGNETRKDLETVMGGVSVGDNAEAGDLSSVNGGIDVGRESVVGEIGTVNGGIEVGRDSRTRSVETVNGGIDLASGVEVDGNVATVNGGIDTRPGVVVTGDLSNINGGITLRGTEVRGDFGSVNGDLYILDGSRIAGRFEVGDSKSWFKRKRKPIKVVIGQDSEVGGPLIFKRPVKLYVHDSAEIGDVDGADVERFSGDRP